LTNRHTFSFITLCVAVVLVSALKAQIDVLTNRYDGQRTGANLTETTLTPANVNVNHFGKLYSYPVDGAVYAQPLYVSGVPIQGTARNVLYVATMNDKLYAFDADSASPSALWLKDFTGTGVTAVPMTDIVSPTHNLIGNVGIESTPVIDRATNTLYLVARTKENGSYFQRLHAVDIRTGAAKSSPMTIAGSVPGTASGGSVITFDPKLHQQRAALALSNGVILVSWASHEDLQPYHGWIMGFDATTLARVAIFSVNPDFYGGGIWHGGRAPTIDAVGNVYFATGNGPWDGVRNFGDSLLKFSVSRSALTLVDYFTPGNEAQLNLADDDLSGSSFTLLPGTNLLLGGGKEGVLYLLNASNLGHKVANDTQIVQKIPVNGGHVMGGPVYWNSAKFGPLVYNWSEDDVLVAYRLSGGQLITYAQGQVRSPGHPGGSLTLSARGSTASTGIVWASIPTSVGSTWGTHAGMLRAFDAETLQEIWTSEQNATRDRAGTLMKFVPPLIVNGRLYMPNHDGKVNVYGLLGGVPDFGVSVTPASGTVAPGSSKTFTISVSAQNGFAGRVDLSATGAPAGTTVTFNPQSTTGAGASTMTVTIAVTAPLGSFNLTVMGTSGTTVHSAPVAVAVAPPSTGAPDVVVHARHASLKAGTWRLVSDPTAAGGERLEHPDAGAPKVLTPLAAPANYVELTFNADAGQGYRLWFRGRAQNDSYNNDSAYAQFDKSVDANGTGVNRIATTQAVPLILEECSGCGVGGWGWADTGYGGFGPLIYFEASGTQTMRIQGREDGLSIDQFVLSATTYLSAAPGAAKNDTTILPETTGTPASGEAVLYAAEAPLKGGAWRVTVDPTAAGGSRIEHPDAGAAKLAAPLANPVNYFELTFSAEAGRPYHLWIRGRAAANSWANDSVFVQFDRSTDAAGAAVYRTGTTNAAIVTLEDCINCGVSGWGWQDNGFGPGVMGPDIYFAVAGTQRLRIQTREDGFSIDQIVLSPSAHLQSSPGALKNDTTILPR
jgi:hypothetical protein